MARTAVGIDLGGTKLLMVAGVEGQREVKHLPTGIEFDRDALHSALKEFLAGLPARPGSIGIAIPGLVSEQGRVIACDVLPKIEGLEAAAFAYAGCPVRLINDAEAALVEESSALHPQATSAILMVGTGIGMAFKMNGSICRGSRGWAGELGKIPLSTQAGVQTLDDLASGAGILARLGGSPETTTRRLYAGDVEAVRVIQEAGFALGLGLASVINLLNPERVILGGGTLNYPGYYPAAITCAEQYAMPDLWKACELRRPRDEKLVAALGAQRYAAPASQPE